jgi:hypothetical protein
MKGLDPYQVSQGAGLHRNYLWESLRSDRAKGSLDAYKKIADHIGLSFNWLVNGHGQPFPPTHGPVPMELDRDLMLCEMAAGLDRAQSSDAARAILEIATHPPAGNLSTDPPNRIRTGVEVLLRLYGQHFAAHSQRGLAPAPMGGCE